MFCSGLRPAAFSGGRSALSLDLFHGKWRVDMAANLFSLSNVTAHDDSRELFEAVLTGGDGLVVERIVSNGQTTPEGQWYDQDRDEWVAVLEGEARLGYDDGREITLRRGDHVFLPQHVKHRVTYTSRPCVWLAIFGRALRESPEAD